LDEVIGNTSGEAIDKFDRFGLTAEPGQADAAPSLAECHANFECRLVDDRLVEGRNFFVFEVVRARVVPEPVCPETLHHSGDGVFMVAVRRSIAVTDFCPSCSNPDCETIRVTPTDERHCHGRGPCLRLATASDPLSPLLG
ncbi:MAG: flavin reductase family protein, partial [Guyparkeria sp.]